MKKPATQMLGLYIASQQIVPAALDYASEELRRENSSNKNIADLIKYGAIPAIKMGGYVYGARLASGNTDEKIAAALSTHSKAHARDR